MPAIVGKVRSGGMKKGPGVAVITAAIIAILVVIILVVGSTAVRRYEDYFSGFWVGDPGFLKKARLKDMQLFVAPGEDGCRQGYILMTDLDGNFVSNQAVEIRERSAVQRWWTALGSTFRVARDCYRARCVDIEYDDSATGEPPMPEHVKMALSILDGTLTIYDDSKVYAFLAKDNAVSAAALAAWAE